MIAEEVQTIQVDLAFVLVKGHHESRLIQNSRVAEKQVIVVGHQYAEVRVDQGQSCSRYQSSAYRETEVEPEVLGIIGVDEG